MADDRTNINGKLMKIFRQSIKMSRAALGRSCLKSGTWIAYIENEGPHVVTPLELYRLAQALRVRPEDLERT
jgi:hypothetical protein